MTDDIDNEADDLEGVEPTAPEPAPTNYEPIKIDAEGKEAGEEEEAALGAFVNPSVDECPVVPLGHYGDRVVFAMPEGEIRHVAASKIGAMLRPDIFASEKGAAFLTYWRDPQQKFHPVLATIWLVRKCREAGYWDSNRTTRSLGVWPGEGRSVVLHLGDQVWSILGKEVVKKTIADMMRVRTGPLYRIAPPAVRPDKKPAKIESGEWFRGALSLWQFEPIGSSALSGADIIAGWIMAALLGGVAPFRGHIVVYGPQGSGKTTLILLVHALASAIAGEVMNSFSEAGFRADISGMARPVFLDETEASANAHGPGPVEQAIVVLRRMSTGDGSRRKQGGGENGGATTQTAIGAAMLGAITPPKLESADGSRIIEIRLRPLPTPGAEDAEATVDVDAQLEKLVADARLLAPAMLSRALVGAPRYRADVAMIKAALRRSGESPRSADLVAMVAAGRRLLLHDKALDDDGADAEVAFWRPLLVQRQASEVLTNVGADALAHLMAHETSIHRQDRKMSVGLMVERFVAGDREFREMLKGYGLLFWEEGEDRAWESDDGGPQGRPGPWLIVANNHPQLKKIFEPTRWVDWRRALSVLDDLGTEYGCWPTKPLRYGASVKQRGLAIPLTPLIERLSPSASDRRSGAVPGNRSSQRPDFNDD